MINLIALNKRGQAFAGYRLIIGAILAFFILLIILGAITYFENIRTQITFEALTSGLNSAKASPDGSIVKKANVYFSQSIYTKRFFSQRTGLSKECFKLLARDDPIVFIRDERQLVIEQMIIENVFFRCVTCDHPDASEWFDTDCEECEINCWVSVGRDLKKEFGLE